MKKSLIFLLIIFSLSYVIAGNANITLLSTGQVRMAPHTVFVHATNSDVGKGTWTTSRFEWDLDSTAQETQHLTTIDPRTNRIVDISKEQQGFNTAYTYVNPGTYTIKLILTNEDNETYTDTLQVTILPDTRQKRYIDSNLGSDSNDGLTTNTPWKTFNHAINQLTHNMTLYFKKGEVFNLNKANSLNYRNTIIDSYGVGLRPIFNWTGLDDGSIIRFSSGSRNMMIRGIKFETNNSMDTTGTRVLEPQGDHTTIWDVEFGGDAWVRRGFNRWISLTDGPVGTFVLNTFGESDSGASTNVPTKGEDFVFIGFKIGEPQGGSHGMRNLGSRNTRVNVQWNDISNNMSGSADTIRFQRINWGHIYQSRLVGGRLQIGFDEYVARDIVVNGNLISNGGMTMIGIHRNVENVMFKNNVLESVIDSRGYNRLVTYRTDRCQTGGYFEIANVSFYNNLIRFNPGAKHHGIIMTDLVGYHSTKSCNFTTNITNFKFSNNLIVADPGYATHDTNFLQLGNESDDIAEIKNNIWPEFCIGKERGCYRIGGTYMNFSNFSNLAVTSNEFMETINLSDVKYPYYSVNTTKYPNSGNAYPLKGVFEDYFGNERPAGIWTVGAVNSNGTINTTLCINGKTKLCSIQLGICKNSFQVCTSSSWPGCDYTSIPNYELTESSCDSLDNDCDGIIDEGCNSTSSSFCGDFTCDSNETCSSCEADCGKCTTTNKKSGGGGSKTVLTNPSDPKENFLTKSQKFFLKNKIYKFETRNRFIKRIDLKMSKDADKGSIELSEKSTPSKPVSKGKILQAFDINPIAGLSDPSTISFGEITFSVPEEWIKDNLIDKEEGIKLARLKNDWAIYDSIFISQEETGLTYKAQVPGFSEFVIIGLTKRELLIQDKNQKIISMAGLSIALIIVGSGIAIIIIFLQIDAIRRKKRKTLESLKRSKELIGEYVGRIGE